MKLKTLIAALGVLASSGALAQSSNVQIYGIVDTGLEYLTHASRTGTTDNDVFRMTAGNLSGSRLGLRGTEDLGGGLKAIFRLENGFDSDTGTLGQGGRLFGRHGYVGLQGGLGALTFGRQQNTFYDIMVNYDPMFFSRYSAQMHDPTFVGRVDNSVKYTVNSDRLTATAFYSFGRNLDGEVPGNPKVSREFGGGVNYAQGPLGAAIAYDQFQGNTIATQDQSARRVLMGASYVVGPFKGFAAYRWLRDEIVAAGAPSVRSNMYWAGVTYKTTPALLLTGVVYYTDFKNTSADPMSIVLASDYALSKRTDLYANLGYVRNKNGSNLGLSGFGSAIIPGQNQTGVVVGIRHQF